MALFDVGMVGGACGRSVSSTRSKPKAVRLNLAIWNARHFRRDTILLPDNARS